MEIKNFLSSLKNLSLKQLTLIFLLLSFAACQTAHVKRPSNKPYSSRGSGPIKPEPEPSGRSYARAVLPVGVFLGPGGVRAFAHIGVLEVLQKAQIPIIVMGGTEWGAAVAATAALGTGVHGPEWEMMKLHDENFPHMGMFHRHLDLQDAQSLNSFFSSVFGDKDLSHLSVPFLCPSTTGGDTQFLKSGLAKTMLPACVAAPPIFSAYNMGGRPWSAAAYSLADWATEMRKMGAQYLIYVDVMSANSIPHDSGQYETPEMVTALWRAMKAVSEAEHPFAQFIIEVKTSVDPLDLGGRRQAIKDGEKAAEDLIPLIRQSVGLPQ